MSKKKKILIIVSIILIIIIALGVTAGVVVNHYLNLINKADNDSLEVVAPEDEDFETDEETDSDSEEVDPDDVELATTEPLDDDSLINILLVGQDRREGQGRQRSDTMILCSINPSTGEVSLISFLRDLYVTIPGDYSDNRLNAAYAFGGFPLLTEALYVNFGVTVDGCFEVDFDGFTSVIDILGGVDIELTEAEAEIVGDGATAGMNHLDGEHALIYARIRKIDSDFGRTNRQRTLLLSVFESLKDSSVSDLLSLADTILPLLTTDMTNSDILSLCAQLAPMFSSFEVSTYYVPAEGTYYSARIRGMAVLVPDLVAIQDLLVNEYLPLD